MRHAEIPLTASAAANSRASSGEKAGTSIRAATSSWTASRRNSASTIAETVLAGPEEAHGSLSLLRKRRILSTVLDIGDYLPSES